MQYHSTYKGHEIYRKTECGNALPWSAYVNGLFRYADTLSGLKRFISQILESPDCRRWK